MSLTGEITSTDKQLVLRYKYANRREHNVYLWDQMVGERDGKRVIDPNSAYIFWGKPSTLRVVRAVLELPPGMNVSVRPYPYVRRVAPGETAEGRVILPLPVREYSPFYDVEGPSNEVRCDRVRLLIGCTEEQPGMKPTPRKVGDQHVFALLGNWERPVHHLEEKVFTYPVTLLVRQDKFDRQMPMQEEKIKV